MRVCVLALLGLVAWLPLPGSLIINEFYRGSSPGDPAHADFSFLPTGLGYIEFLVTRDMSLAELNHYYFGDVNLPNGSDKFSAYQFNLEPLSLGRDRLPAGTRIVVGGGQSVPATDLSLYAPELGLDDARWTLYLSPEATGLTIHYDRLEVDRYDMLWLDTQWPEKTLLEGIRFLQGIDEFSLKATIVLDLSVQPLGTVSYLGAPSDPNERLDPAYWQVTGPTIGTANSPEEWAWLLTVREEEIAVVPEPAQAVTLLALAALAVALSRRRERY